MKPFNDPNLIIDDETPNSVSNTVDACTLSDLLGIDFDVSPAKKYTVTVGVILLLMQNHLCVHGICL